MMMFFLFLLVSGWFVVAPNQVECKAKKTGEFDAEDQDEVSPINPCKLSFSISKNIGEEFLQQKTHVMTRKKKQNSLRSPFK